MQVTICLFGKQQHTQIFAYYSDGIQYLQVGRIKCDIRSIRLDIISVLNQLLFKKTVFDPNFMRMQIVMYYFILSF